MSTGGPTPCGLAPEVVTRFPPKGFRDYGTERSYMKAYLSHGVGPLRAGGRGGSTDLFPIGWSSRQEGCFPTLLEASMGLSRTARPDPHFAPFLTSFDVRGASCFAIPLSRVFLACRIRPLPSTFLSSIASF